MKIAQAVALMLLLTVAAMAVDLARSFEEAVKISDDQAGVSALHQYETEQLTPYYEKKYSPVFESCLNSTPGADTSGFTFVAAIGADGRVLRLYVDHDTEVYRCLRKTLETDEFPHPPAAPFYWQVEMSLQN